MTLTYLPVEPFNTLCSGIDLSALKVGDILTFGIYPQGANGEVRPIEWQVLRRDNDGLLVISKYALDCQPYHEILCDITWSQCTLRNWLNSDFINRAFTEQECQQIKEVHLNNPDSPSVWNNVPGGPDTDDKVFLLSRDEALQLFANDDSRLCKATDFAKKNNALTNDDGICWWWLRSPGDCTNIAAGVDDEGEVYGEGDAVSEDDSAVRPVIKIAF